MLCRIALGTLLLLGWSSLCLGQGRTPTTGGAAAEAGGGAVGGSGFGQNLGAGTGTGTRQAEREAGGGFLNRAGDAAGFLGGGAAGVANAAVGNAGNANRAGGQFGNFGGGRARGFGQGGRGIQPQQNRPTRVIRTRLVIPRDFRVPVVAAPRIQNKLSNQFGRVLQLESKARVKEGSSRAFFNANVTISTSGQTVTLRGRVASERDRSIAEKLAKFEPGVVRVVNELTVVPAS